MTEEIQKELRNFEGLTFEQQFEKLDKEYAGSEWENELRRILCNNLLYAITMGDTHYNLKKDFLQSNSIKLYTINVQKLPKDEHFLWAVYYLYTRQNRSCIQEVEYHLNRIYDDWNSENHLNEPLTEYVFVEHFLEPFKTAYPGFWQELAGLFRTKNAPLDLIEYAETLHVFYALNYEALEFAELVKAKTQIMLDFLNIHPQFSSAKELLAGVLYGGGHYKEAKKYFEETEEKPLIYLDDNRYWKMAWIYGKCKEFAKEEHYYRLVLETGVNYEYLKNNLGYCLYRQKKYDKAEELFLDCIRNNQGMPYAANNYVRLLVKCNRAEEAREFVDNGGYKVAKDFQDRLERLEEQIRAGMKIGQRKKKGPESGKSERKTEVDQTYKGVPQKMDDFIEVKSNGEVSAKMGVNYRTPYDHQKDAMKNMDIMDKEEAYSTLIVLPTGGGKTYTASMWLIRHALNRHKKILWIAHRQMLLDQAAESFQNYAYAEVMPNITSFNYRIVSGAVNHDRTIDIVPTDNLLIASKDSLGRNMECLKTWFDGEGEVYLIVDEAHHATAKTYRRIIDYVKENVVHTKVIGLTATPFRTEESEQGLLAKIFSDGVEHGKAVKNASGITYKIDLKELIGRGILSKPIFESYYTEAAFGDGLGIDDWESISRLDVIPEKIAKQMTDNAARNKLIVNTYLDKCEDYGQTIVFAINIPHAISLAKLFNQAGVPADYIISGTKDMITGVTTSREKNDKALESYRNGELNVLVNVNILTEGVDLPQTKTVFLVRPTVSTILMTQMVGRALRGQKAGGTSEAYIVSFVDKWNEHISWVNPESLFVDADNDFTENDIERQKHELRMIAISKIEEFAAILDKSVDTSSLERVSFTERIPIGMYLFTRTLPNDMEQSHQIMVYNSTKQAYENMMSALPLLFESFGVDAEFPSDAELKNMAMQCEDTFFTGEMIPPYEENDIVQVLGFYAQYECAPDFYAFKDIDRNRIDVSVIAKDMCKRNLSRSEEAEYINSLWESTDNNLLRLFFGRKNTFLEMLDIEMRKLLYKDAYEKENVKFGIREYADMPLYEIRKYNPDYEKGLRDSVFAAAKDMHGNYVCANCGKSSKSRIIFQVDHIKPLSRGGKSVLGNFQLLCCSCNAEKSDK